MAMAPNGDLLVSNNDVINSDPNQPSEIVEFTPKGHFKAEFSVNPNGLGGAFGIALASVEDRVYLATVDDILNTLDVWRLVR